MLIIIIALLLYIAFICTTILKKIYNSEKGTVKKIRGILQPRLDRLRNLTNASEDAQKKRQS